MTTLLEDLENLAFQYRKENISREDVVETLRGIIEYEDQERNIIKKRREYINKRKEYMRKYIAKKRKQDPEYAKRQREVARKYYHNNKEKVAQYQKEKRTNEYSREYMKKRRRDPYWRITDALRSRVYHAMKRKRGRKSLRTLHLLGVKDFQDVINHLVSQFKEGMTLDNYGQWHVDHIRPCSSFNLLDIEEQKKCFHYTNLQPLWAEENISKGNKINV